MTDDISSKQKEVLDQLPGTRKDIANTLGISRRAVRYRMDKLEDYGYEFYMTNDDVWHEGDVEQDIERDDLEPWRVNSYNKAQATKELNNELLEIEKEIKQALGNISPVVSEYNRSDGSTLFMPHSDAHIGAVIQERDTVSYYSAEEAQDSIRQYFDKGINYAREIGGVDDVVLVLNGDQVDGEGIYPHQRHGQEDNLRDQVRKAGQVYIEQVKKLSDEFEHVSIYCVPGNHGNIDKRSTTNADMMLYDFVEIGISNSQVDNVNIVKAGPGGYVNIDIHGWRFHARHGDDFLNHVGTSSGQNRAKDAYMTYQYDVLIRSHYHSVLYETIGDELPIIMTGSPAPPSTFAESRGADGGRCGVFWIVDEGSAVNYFNPIRIS